MLPDVLSALLRALSFVAVIQAGGGALFLVLFDRDAAVTRQRIGSLVRASALIGAVLLVAQYLMEPARMAGALSGIFDAQLQSFALHSRAAPVLGMRLLALLLVLGARRGGDIRRGIAVTGVILIALSFPATGHTADHDARWWLIPLLALHVLVVQFWFGALLPLALIAAREPPRMAAQIVEHFSRMAFWLVPLIFIAGVLIALRLLPDMDALLKPYGLGLVVKVVLFAALMCLAALNKWRLGPALARGESRSRMALRQSITIEWLLITLVLVVTAILTTFWSPMH